MPVWISVFLGAGTILGGLVAAWWMQRTSLTNTLFARIATLEARLTAQDQAFLTLSSELINVKTENLTIRQENFQLRERLQMLEQDHPSAKPTLPAAN